MRYLTKALMTLTLLLSGAAFAQQGITVEHAWSRPTAAGGTGAVYLTIRDTGAPDSLTGASSPIARQVELHETINDHGVMKMRPVASVVVEAGKPVQFSPGGYHVMLVGLNEALISGRTFPLTLIFAHAGAVNVTVTVGTGAAQGGMGDMPGMPGMSH